MHVDDFSAKRQESEIRLSPERTAVLVVDMLNEFCKPGGRMVLDGYEKLLAPQQRILDAARARGATVVYCNDAHRPDARCDREFLKRATHCIEGTWGAQVIDELAPQAGDLQVTKRRYSGFFNTDLDLSLRDMMIDTVIVVGVVTNICVRSTVHDAFFLGYGVVVPQDAVAATGPREQESSLYDIGTHFGAVVTAADVADALESGRPLVNLVTD
jgi:ureidoacrylate peracid hydrolase